MSKLHVVSNRQNKKSTYTGVIERGGERATGAHKPIIKKESFEQVKEALPLRKLKPRVFVSPNLFTGFIFCGCGSPMHMSYPDSESKKNINTMPAQEGLTIKTALRSLYVPTS